MEESILGTGWKFPPSFNKSLGSVRMSTDLEDIEESIRIILGTTPGERLMQPDFGCHLKLLMFEKLDAQLEKKMQDMIYYALLHFEPRIKDVSTRIIEEHPLMGLIVVSVDFNIIITNTRHNIVFPFYLEEGTNL